MLMVEYHIFFDTKKITPSQINSISSASDAWNLQETAQKNTDGIFVYHSGDASCDTYKKLTVNKNFLMRKVYKK